MRTLRPFLFILFILTSYSCNPSSNKADAAQEEAIFVETPFEAEFIGTYKYTGPDTLATPKCTDTLSVWRAIVDGKGTANMMGAIRVHFDFCGNQNGFYGNTYSYFVDTDNDSLFIALDGQVVPGKLEDHPDFVVSYWKDDFMVLGGTGKYEGATGKGATNDYNSSEDTNSHHFWKGTLSLKSK